MTYQIFLSKRPKIETLLFPLFSILGEDMFKME